MKPNAHTRKPYGGSTRSLVIALDVGTTFSGVSYAILEPGEVPKIHGVTRFPGQEHVAGNSKIPTVMYYDKIGRMRAAGAEAESSSVQTQAEDEGWIKEELFKLRLRPKTMKLQMNGMRLNPLPPRKTATDVFGDFLSYLYICTRNFFIDTHANGPALWKAVEHDIQFVLSHPNGWEGAQQANMRNSAVSGGLIPDTNEGKARIRFVTEGEASLHACVLNGLAADVLSHSSKSGFLIADAGGGTLDISSYSIRGTFPLVIEEIAPPDCVFAGSVFVSRRAREFLGEKLKNSKYGYPDALDHITKRFDETTKRLFRDRRDVQFIPFGSPLDKDVTVGIRGGQLKLSGDEVADLFVPSVEAAVASIRAQIDASAGVVKSVWLVGGFAASPFLFKQLQERLAPLGVTVSRPDSQTSKAVADGAIGFYCDHYVSARMSKFMYGVEYLREYNPQDEEHVARRHRLCELPSGPRLLPDAFDCILARSVKVKESTVFTRKYCTELTNLSTLAVFEVDVWCYRGNTIPKWIFRQGEEFSTLCVVRADLSPLSGSAKAKQGQNGKVYWTIVFSVEIHFGLTEFKARIKWVDDGRTKYGPASIIYNESGFRAGEDELEEEAMPVPSRFDKRPSKPASRARSRDSFPVSGSMTRENSKGSSPYEPPKSHVAFVDAPHPRTSGIERTPSQGVSPSPYSPYSYADRDSRREKEVDKGKGKEVERGRSSEKGKEREKTPKHQPADASISETLTSVWGPMRSSNSPILPPAITTPAISNPPSVQAKTPKDKTPIRTPIEVPRSFEPVPAETPSIKWGTAKTPPSPRSLPPVPQVVSDAPVPRVTTGKGKKKEKTPSPAWGSSIGIPNSTSLLGASATPIEPTTNQREPSGRPKEKEKTPTSLWNTFGTPASHAADPVPERTKTPNKSPIELPPRSSERPASTRLPDVPHNPSTSPSKFELPAFVEPSISLSMEISGAWDGNQDEGKKEPNGIGKDDGSFSELSRPMNDISLFEADPQTNNDFSFSTGEFGVNDTSNRDVFRSTFDFGANPHALGMNGLSTGGDHGMDFGSNHDQAPYGNDNVENVNEQYGETMNGGDSWFTPDPAVTSDPVPSVPKASPKAVVAPSGKKKKKGGSTSIGQIVSAPEEPSTLLSTAEPLSNTFSMPSPLDNAIFDDVDLQAQNDVVGVEKSPRAPPNPLPDAVTNTEETPAPPVEAPPAAEEGGEGGADEEKLDLGNFAVAQKKKKKKSKKT